MTEPTIQLDATMLQRVAQLICGDDMSAKYRKTYEIEQFFKVLGVDSLPSIDVARVPWVVTILTELQQKSPQLMTSVILRIADPREYLDDPDAQHEVVAELNQLMALEELVVVNCDTRPQLVPLAERGDRIASDHLREFTVQPAELLSDPEVVRLVDDRIAEARRCTHAEAYIAAVIILGGALEMLLLYFTKEREPGLVEPKEPKRKSNSHGPSLGRLINVAHQKGWIRTDIKAYADVLRDHRNLAHPDMQRRDNYAPDRNNVVIGWNVFAAVLDDLAAAPPAAGPEGT